MSSDILERRFAVVGARIRVMAGPWLGEPRIDVDTDSHGEYFDVRFSGGHSPVNLEVIDVKPRDRHLLLLARTGQEKSKFLCGHDERHWFVAAVPESARGVTGVVTAKAALQPEVVRDLILRTKPKDPFRRRNTAYLRQGEWFFVPAEGISPADALVLRDEPLTRGHGKVHVMQFAFRRGGEVVYVNRQHPTGISEARFVRLTDTQRRTGNWEPMVRDPEVYAKGTLRHPDHATIQLADWHRVLMNTEQDARAMRHVAFID
jgi:hypothetical protein